MVMRESAIAPGGDDGEFGPRPFGTKGGAGGLGQRGLGHAGAQGGTQGLLRQIGNPGVFAQSSQFGGIFAQTQMTHGFGGKAATGAGQGLQQQKRVIGAHRLIQRDRAHRAKRGEGLCKGSPRPGVIAPFPERPIALAAHIGGI